MKNKILATIIIISLLSVSSMVSADFDCTTLDRDKVMFAMEKLKDGETLTTAESTLIENTKSCKLKGRWGRNKWNSGTKWDRLEMTDGQKTKMEEMQVLLKKQQNWETLTITEQTKLDTFESQRWERTWNKKNTKTNTKTDSILSTAYKTKIDTSVTKLVLKVSGYSDIKKITTLEAFNAKISVIKVKVSNMSSYSDIKKAKYTAIFNYFTARINSEINIINGEEIDENLLDGLFD